MRQKMRTIAERARGLKACGSDQRRWKALWGGGGEAVKNEAAATAATSHLASSAKSSCNENKNARKAESEGRGGREGRKEGKEGRGGREGGKEGGREAIASRPLEEEEGPISRSGDNA